MVLMFTLRMHTHIALVPIASIVVFVDIPYVIVGKKLVITLNIFLRFIWRMIIMLLTTQKDIGT